MFNLIKILAAVPFRALAKLLGIGGFMDTTSLWAIVFKLTCDGDDGSSFLYTIYLRYGIDEARNSAEKIIEMTKSAKPAALIASIEFHQGNLEGAQKWVKSAEGKNTEDLEQLLVIKLYLSEFFSVYDKRSIVDQILSINYLPMEVTRLALIEKAFIALEDKNWPLAENIANRILSVEEHFSARIVKAAIALVNNRMDEAEKMLKLAQQKVMPAQFYPMASHALLCIGHTEMAMEYLCRAGKLDSRLVESNSIIGKLARSQEFAEYCLRRRQK